MGFFSDLMTDIFGGADKGEIRAQREENVRVREDLGRLTGQAENAIGTYLPIADERMRQGLMSASDVLRQTPQAQIQALQGYGSQAQDSLLGGMNAYRAAILGIPNQTSFQPMTQPEGVNRPFQVAPPASWQESNLPGRPAQQQPFNFSQFLSGMGGYY